jgi:hypothetical protein
MTGTFSSAIIDWKTASATFGSNTEAISMVELNAGAPWPAMPRFLVCQFQAASS